VGSVLNVRPNLERVQVLVEVDDDSIVLPRNSKIEAAGARHLTVWS
jgi:hypothetical protein